MKGLGANAVSPDENIHIIGRIRESAKVSDKLYGIPGIRNFTPIA